MKRGMKILLCIFLAFLILAAIFFCIDFVRIQQEKEPLFCIPTTTYKDGGTREYLGLGYKVIAYQKINGYHQSHIGTWFLQYDENLDGGLDFRPVEGPPTYVVDPVTNKIVPVNNNIPEL